jgi:hypothetical protein
MNTDHLIAALAADTTIQHPPVWRLRRTLPLALVVVVGALLLFWGLRPDLGRALGSAAVVKTAGPALISVVGAGLALHQSRPEAGGKPALLLLLVGGAGLGVVYLGMMMAAPLAPQMAAVDKASLWVCLMSVPALAVLPLAGMLWSLRSGATTRPALAGALAGLTAGGMAAAVYSLYCIEDDPLFFVPTYGLAVTAVVLAGLLIGHRLLRW